MFQVVLRCTVISQNVPVLGWRNLNLEKEFVLFQFVIVTIERAGTVLAIPALSIRREVVLSIFSPMSYQFKLFIGDLEKFAQIPVQEMI